MNISHVHKLMLFAITALFNTMYSAGTEEPITIAYDAHTLVSAKKSLPEWLNTSKNVANILHEFETGSRDTEYQFLVFELIHNLIKEKPERVNEADGGGDSPLYNAVRFKLEAFAALFIAYGATMPVDQNDKKHPLTAWQPKDDVPVFMQENFKNGTFKPKEPEAYTLVAAYTQAQDKEAFRKHIKQRLQIPGITLFEKTITPKQETLEASGITEKTHVTTLKQDNPLPTPTKGIETQTSKQPTQDRNNKNTRFYMPLIAGAALCVITAAVYALYNKIKSPDTLSSDTFSNQSDPKS